MSVRSGRKSRRIVLNLRSDKPAKTKQEVKFRQKTKQERILLSPLSPSTRLTREILASGHSNISLDSRFVFAVVLCFFLGFLFVFFFLRGTSLSARFG